MKGYTEVDRNDIRAACVFWSIKNDRGLELLREGIVRYREKHLDNANVYVKWRAENMTDREFAIWHSNSTFFIDWTQILEDVMTKDELALVDLWEWRKGGEHHRACQALVDASNTNPMLDNVLCAWVNEHKTWIEEKHNV